MQRSLTSPMLYLLLCYSKISYTFMTTVSIQSVVFSQHYHNASNVPPFYDLCISDTMYSQIRAFH